MQNFFSSLLNILFPSKQNTKIVNYYQFSSRPMLEFFNSLLNKLFPSRQNQNNDKFPSNMLKYFKSWLNKQNPEIENDITAETAVKVVIIVLVIICLSKFIKFLLRRLKWRRNGPNIIHTANECHNAVLELRKKCKDVRVIGLDCEWVFEGRIALLQLASIDGYCSLIRLCALGHVPSSLEALLSDRSIIKTGVAVNSDASRLLRDYGVRCNGVLDLRYMAQAVGSVPAGLGKMSNLYLNKELDKDRSIACSNWEAGCLSERQIQYAADDALVSVQLFQYFNNLMLTRDLSWYKRLFWSYKKVWARVEWYWRSYIDLPFPGDPFPREINIRRIPQPFFSMNQ